ncbi:MAG: hypothetical protein RRA94_12435 [Bacteroidota bacterium]|nr:hypothetical protein [Bacteroidota bacterium]
MRTAVLLLLLCSALFAAACDHGLSPEATAVDPGFGGTLTVTGSWPPADSVRDFRIVAFRNYPPKDILSEVINGSAVFSDPLPYGEKDIPYLIQDESLQGSFAYVVVAQNYGEDPFQDWRAVGVFTTTGDVTRPSPVDLGGGRFVSSVDITVNFYDLPPQPF